MTDIFYKKEMIMESIEFDSYLPIREGFGYTIKNIFDTLIKMLKRFFDMLIDKTKNIFKMKKMNDSNNKKEDINEDETSRTQNLPKEPLNKPLQAKDVQKRFDLYSNESSPLEYDYYEIFPIDSILRKVEDIMTKLNSLYDKIYDYDEDTFIESIYSIIGTRSINEISDVIDFGGRNLKNLYDVDASVVIDYYNRGEKVIDSLKKNKDISIKNLDKARKEYDDKKDESEKTEELLFKTKYLCSVIRKINTALVNSFNTTYSDAIKLLKFSHCI